METDCPDKLDQQIQDVLGDSSTSGWKQYAQLALGHVSLSALLHYEWVTSWLGGCPGALGYWLRRTFYRSLFASMGRGVILGRHITLRGARRIQLGDGVALDDGVVLDARGEHGRIEVEDGVLISRNTIVRARNGLIRIGRGSDIGANCILATDSQLTLGEDVLVAAYTYLCAGGNHAYDRIDIPIIRQGFKSKGGCVIEDDVWIGSHTTVLDGVQIGKGSIVGAHALVNRDIPAGVIAWGQPARSQRSRTGPVAAEHFGGDTV